MHIWRAGGILLTLLWGLSWFIPPWGWGIPFITALIWTYAGGGIFLIGIILDKRYRQVWLPALLLWLVSLRYIWNFFPPPTPSGTTIRMATFNMDAAHYRRPQIERIADSLKLWHPQILCLQEVYLGDYTVEAFARRLGYTYYAFLDAKMHMGMMVLSDFPIERHLSHLLLPGTTNGFHEVWLKLPNGEHARILHIHFPSYRLGREGSWQWTWLSQTWQRQAGFHEKLRQRLSEAPSTPVWVCGDFNTLPFHPLYRFLGGRLYDSHTAAAWGSGPTWRRILRIDYIWGPIPALQQTIRWLPAQAHACVEAKYALSSEHSTFAGAGR